jgi:hypothetical protein
VPNPARVMPAIPTTSRTDSHVGYVYPVMPYGGDTARSMLAVHVPERWTGVCRGCRDRYPCRDRRDAQYVLGVTHSSVPHRLTWLSIPILIGMLLIAVAAMELFS